MKFIKKMEQLLQEENTLQNDITELLLHCDSSFIKEEQEFSAVLLEMQANLSIPDRNAFENYLHSENKRISDNLLFLFWNGLYQNLRCFQNPTNKLFLQLDFETIHKEYLMNRLTSTINSKTLSQNLYTGLDVTEHKYLDTVTSYYCALETTAYKIAHYLGFKFADTLLCKVIPGYTPDTALTSQYSIMLQQFLGFSLQTN